MEYTREMVLRKVRQLFASPEPSAVLAILDGYGSQSYEWEPARVHLGILKLCAGRLDQLPGLVALAKSDPRDVIAYAESEGEMRHFNNSRRTLSAQKMQAIRHQDRRQWLEWLQQ